MKIDLHCHTKRIKAGDPLTREVTPELFAKKVKDAGVDIIAVTNHNIFDYEQYIKLKEAVTGECSLWPGVEFDVICKKSQAHMLVICNPTNIEAFNERVRSFTDNISPNNFSAKVEDIISNFESLDVIFIPHHFKEPSISDDDIEDIKKQLKDPSRLFLESTYRSVGILANVKQHIIAGSDVRNWQEYEKCSFPELRLRIDNFNQFCLLAKKDEQVIKTLLDRKKPIKAVAKPHPDTSIELMLYPDINVFFGQKGTGKTKLLESLEEAMQSQGRTCSSYYSYKRESDFSSYKQKEIGDIPCEKLADNDCRSEFQVVFNWLDSSPNDFQDYISCIESATTKKSRLEFLLADSDHLELKKYDRKARDDYKTMIDVKTSIHKILLKQYVDKDITNRIESDIDKLIEAIYEKYETSWIEETAIKLANHMIDKIREHADEYTGAKSKPLGTGLLNFYESRIELHQAVKPIYTSLFELPEVIDYELFGDIEGKGTLFSRTRYRFCCKQSEAKEYQGTLTVIKKLTKLIESVYMNPFMLDISSSVLKIKSECNQKSISNISPFIGISLDYVLDKQYPYSPSAGEKGMILLENKLSEDSDVYILDEPEMGMGSSFINTLIIPQLNHLARLNKFVIVSTHNANVAVRTLPYLSVYREHSDGTYYTFIGNPFLDKLKEIDNLSPDRNWTEVSMHILEGGKEAFYERKLIYES